MASKSKQESIVQTELERLRDILYGEYARTTELRLDDLEGRLREFRREILAMTGDSETQLNNQLEANRQSVADQIDRLGTDTKAQIAQLRAEMAEHMARIEERLADRRVLGRLLVDLGQELQQEGSPAANGQDAD